MLKQRIFTIAVTAPAFIALVLYSSHIIFACVILLLLLLAAYEWGRLSGIHSLAGRFGYLASCGGIIALTVVFHRSLAPYRDLLYAATLCWWLLVVIWLILYQCNGYVVRSRALKLVMGAFTLLPPWYALTHLYAAIAGPAWVLFLFLLVWAADIGAYIGGKLYGRVKLADAISPGKTLEGLVGGLVAAALTVGAASFYFDAVPVSILIAIGMVTAVLSVIGDLFESLMKRMAQVKDSGAILPGHGGVLDRIDSMTIAAPTFVFAWLRWIA